MRNKNRQKKWTFLQLTIFLFSPLPLLFPSPSLSQETPKKEGGIGNYRTEGIDVVQRRVFRKSLRHEFSADGGIIADNQFIFYELAQARYTFHFRETLGFEGSYSHAFHQEKAIVADLSNIPCPSPNSDLDGDGQPDIDCGLDLNPPPDPLKNAYFGNIIWSPIYGKFSIFSKKIYHFDLFVVAGAGLFDNERSNRFGFNIGIGTKVFVNDWFAVRADFRNITVREDAPFNHIANNRILSLGVSIFLPTKPYE